MSFKTPTHARLWYKWIDRLATASVTGDAITVHVYNMALYDLNHVYDTTNPQSLEAMTRYWENIHTACPNLPADAIAADIRGEL